MSRALGALHASIFDAHAGAAAARRTRARLPGGLPLEPIVAVRDVALPIDRISATRLEAAFVRTGLAGPRAAVLGGSAGRRSIRWRPPVVRSASSRGTRIATDRATSRGPTPGNPAPSHASTAASPAPRSDLPGRAEQQDEGHHDDAHRSARGRPPHGASPGSGSGCGAAIISSSSSPNATRCAPSGGVTWKYASGRSGERSQSSRRARNWGRPGSSR